MGLYDKNSNVNPLYKQAARKLVTEIEREFNTKVFDFGIAEKGTPDFEALTPFMTVPPSSAKYIFYFLIPIDDADNVITNNYFEKSQKLNENSFFSPLSMFGASDFQSILRQDWDVSDFLQNKIQSTVYDIGSLKVDKYNGGENIVPNADKIDDLRYRFFRFFSTD
jgi:hypothetical protein